ncbi:MAG: pantoate--beta-alanine ligase [Bryobacterales bacterium]
MSVELADSIAVLRARLNPLRRAGKTIGLVPTMGALHVGHVELIRRARRESDCVVVSIFVNPIQFDRNDDFDRYPRPMADDLRVCEQEGVDVVFAPLAAEMYPRPQRAFVEVETLTDHLCGAFRPGHFRGVATVVTKLFNIVQPGRAYFGEKDAQQLAVIRRMVADLNMPLAIIEVPTVREDAGLAVSSRNAQLTAEQRRSATVLYQALAAVREQVAHGERDAAAIKQQALTLLARQPAVRLEYFEVVDSEEMQPVVHIERPVRIAAAVWVGATRLIDNVLVEI